MKPSVSEKRPSFLLGLELEKEKIPLLLRLHLFINFFLPESFLQLESHCISNPVSDILFISLTVLDL